MESSLAHAVALVAEAFSKKPLVVIGIDGESYAGKTTFGKYLTSKFPGSKLVSLDSCLADPTTRKHAYGDSEMRTHVYDFWFDKDKVAALVSSLDGHVIIEGTFLLSAIPPEVFDLVLVISSPTDLVERRISAIQKGRPRLSHEEANIFDEIYRIAWQKYAPMTRAGNKAVCIDLSGR